MTTTIGSNTHIAGRVEGDADLDVAGSIEGSVAISQKLTVLESGFVKGDVEAADVQIDGAFEGTLKVTGLLLLTASANVSATIETGSLVLEDGAALSGDVSMDVEGDVPRRSSAASSSPSR
jgi:cytoskeletal protein CcmA (bactofilin family)